MRLVENLATIPLLVIVHIGAIALLARLLGAQVYEISFGFGPALGTRRIRGTVLALRAIPLGGFVRSEPGEEDDTLGETPDGIPLSDFGRLARAFVYMGGCLATFGLAAALLGVSTAAASFARAFGQFVGGAWAPLSQGVANLQALVDLLRVSSFPACLGVVASKIAALNLMPIPSLNGFQVLASLLVPGSRNPDWFVWAMNLGSLMLFVVLLSYGAAAAWMLWE
jgi:membrane-associated protease RseP (regulator of RpoE activity)